MISVAIVVLSETFFHRSEWRIRNSKMAGCVLSSKAVDSACQSLLSLSMSTVKGMFPDRRINSARMSRFLFVTCIDLESLTLGSKPHSDGIEMTLALQYWETWERITLGSSFRAAALAAFSGIE